jgi:hypothetical protein
VVVIVNHGQIADHVQNVERVRNTDRAPTAAHLQIEARVEAQAKAAHVVAAAAAIVRAEVLPAQAARRAVSHNKKSHATSRGFISSSFVNITASCRLQVGSRL